MPAWEGIVSSDDVCPGVVPHGARGLRSLRWVIRTLRARSTMRRPRSCLPRRPTREFPWIRSTARRRRIPGSAFPASPPSRAACTRRCTAAAPGRSASTRGWGSPEDTNGRFRYLLAQGVSGLSVAFDLPTQMGYGFRPRAGRGRSGQGRRFYGHHSIEDVATLLREHPARSRVDVDDDQRDGDHPAGALHRRRRGDSRAWRRRSCSARCRTTSSRSTLARGTYIYPPGPSLRLAADVLRVERARGAEVQPDLGVRATTSARRAATRCRRWRSPSRTGSPTSRPWSTAGVDIDVIAPRFSFNISTMRDFFEEIAKHRAARRIWSDARSATASAPRMRARCSCACSRAATAPR